jgi:hypothetical protein
VLAVKVLVLSIYNIENRRRASVAFSRAVNFELYAEPSVAFPVEYGLRFVVVIVDGCFLLVPDVTVIAPGFIFFIVFVVGIIPMNDGAAVLTGGVVAVVARLAECCVVIADAVIRPHALPALSADLSVFAQALGAQQGIIEGTQLL